MPTPSPTGRRRVSTAPRPENPVQHIEPRVAGSRHPRTRSAAPKQQIRRLQNLRPKAMRKVRGESVKETPDDIGQLAVYLTLAENVTGQAINVDGGIELH